MSNLDGVRAKVGRAVELLDAIDGEVAAWLHQYPNPIVVRRDDQRRIDEFIWNIPDPPPTHIALLVGDAIHNLRSSLDHLVWALSTTHGRSVPKGRSKHIQFPICRDPRDWPGALGRSLKYVDRGAQAIIESLQPYQGANPPLLPYGIPANFDLSEYDPLLVLHRWDIIDKHRTLHTMGVQATGGFHSTDLGGEFNMLYPRSVEHGTPIAWIRYDYFRPPPSHDEMDMNVQFPADVAIKEDPPTWGLRASVGDICRFIERDVIPKFDAFF